MILDIIGEICIVIIVVFLFVASSILAWEKQDKKHKAARKWMREVKKNDKNN